MLYKSNLWMVVVVTIEVGSLNVCPVGQSLQVYVCVFAFHPVVSHVQLDNLVVDVVAHGSIGTQAVEE